VTPKRKLIEVALPLEAINRESTRENYIYKRNPSSVHKWWAQRPLAAARAVLFAQLVDDPSSLPEQFPTEEAQKAERERLHRIIERLVVWENMQDEGLLIEAHAEILKSTDGNPPPILDPFAGGGTIPLEAQRLGLEAHASDLNPVAVLINKALIEIPPKFRNQPPVFPGLADSQTIGWKGPLGLAADVRAYGEWMRDEAQQRIGDLYPKATLPDGSKANVIAWIWARTVTCPNPACGIEMPLVRSWCLGKKKGKEAYIAPSIVPDATHPSGSRVEFDIRHPKASEATPDTDGTVGRAGAHCVSCGSGIELKYVRAEGRAARLGVRLMSVVAEGNRTRVYLPPSDVQVRAADVERPADIPDAAMPPKAPSFRVQAYGMNHWVDLFTNRQLTALTTFSDLVTEARDRVLADALSAGMPSGQRLEGAGTGAEAYADSVATYLGLAISKTADYSNTLAVWYPKEDRPKNMFADQSIPMVWDFPEVNPLGTVGGSWVSSVRIVSESFEALGHGPVALAKQANAAQAVMGSQALLSTDPPYYDNIGYSDLSDFFYVWLRRSLNGVHQQLLSTMLVPKADELVANPFRHEGRSGARQFFERGFRDVFSCARLSARHDYPITVYYAFKQSEATEEGTGSSGWETLLDGMIRSGWSITATWPVRSERGQRRISLGANALASSIVLALRPRSRDAPTTDRRGFIVALHEELPRALRDLQQGAISPVDLPQTAIGPGMAIFSRYSTVIESDGSSMTVRSALARINEILDQVLNEMEGDFDATTRFALAWYRLHGYITGPYGDAEKIALQRVASVASMGRDGILTSGGGKVTLLRPPDMPTAYDVLTDQHTSTWEALHHLIRLLDTGGVHAAGEFLATAVSRPDGTVDADLVKELAFLLFSLAEKNGWTKDALAFNTLATSWPEIVDASRSTTTPSTSQPAFDFDQDE